MTFWPRSSNPFRPNSSYFWKCRSLFLVYSFYLWTRFTGIYITIIRIQTQTRPIKNKKKLFDRLMFHVVKVLSINIITLEGYRSRYINNTFIKDEVCREMHSQFLFNRRNMIFLRISPFGYSLTFGYLDTVGCIRTFYCCAESAQVHNCLKGAFNLFGSKIGHLGKRRNFWIWA